MKRLLIAALVTIGFSLTQPAAPEWSETALPRAYCYALGAQGVNCLPRTDSATPTPPVATPTPTRTPIPPTVTPAPPVLTNGDFESGSLGWQVVVASGVARGEVYNALAHDGATSLMWIDHSRCWRAGVMQTVAVTPLTRYRFSAWGRTWAGAGQGIDLTIPSNTNVTDWVAVGTDANGGTDYTASGINWSQNTATEQWAQASVVSTALSNRMTVFVLLNQGVSGPPGAPGAACEWPLGTLAAWLDGAALESVP